MDGVPIHQHLLRDASDKQGQAIRFQHIDSFCRGSAVQFFTMSMALSGGNLLSLCAAFAKAKLQPLQLGVQGEHPFTEVQPLPPEIGWRHIKRSHSAGSAFLDRAQREVEKKRSTFSAKTLKV